MGGRDQSERLVAINRNSWSRSSRAPTCINTDEVFGTHTGAAAH
jgi:hypothetical protein